MTEAEHLAIALRMAELADQLYQGGDDILGVEALWGAVNRILNAIAIQQGLAENGTLPRRGVVTHHLTRRQLADQQTVMMIERGMHSVRVLHGHFYNSHLAPADVAIRVAAARVFIADLIGVYQSGGGR